jgi:LuxR family maltose regulon positive regulatory protein
VTNEPETALFPHLLQTKLAPPRKRSGAIERGELVNRLAATAALTTLTVVEAPAGWGKSTLLGQWLQATGRPERHAWFSLEETDNDPSIFWAYVVEAINRVEPGVGRGPARLLRAPGTTAVDHVVPSLLNALDQATDHITLVLDDYHLIGNDEIHYAMSFFVRHLPAVAHLAISTRTQPPLPIARLRTRGEVVELGIDDLRFTDEDARTLLERECGVALQPADVKLLHDRTEGWAAGLHLAALSLRGRPDLERLIDQFAGDDRLVVDYLMSEVLDRQPADIRQFLCRTAVLDRFCGPLCDAVTGETGSEATIERIEREQLFLIPLDNRRLWYRYHHLFGDLLRRELTRADPTLAVELHRRASAWFGDHDGPADAIKHAFLAGEARQAADLLSETYMYFLGEGQHDTVLGWFQQIPEDVIRSDGQLCMARALTLSMNGRLTDVEAWLVAAEQAPPVTAPLTGFFPSLEAAINLTRSTVQYSLGNVTEAERWSKRAHEVVPADGSEDRFLTSYVLGASAYRNGDLDTAVHWLERDAAWAEATGYHLLNVIALSHLGLIRVLQGRTGLARRLVTKGLAVSEAHGLDEHTSSALLHLVDGQLRTLRAGQRTPDPYRRPPDLEPGGASARQHRRR